MYNLGCSNVLAVLYLRFERRGGGGGWMMNPCLTFTHQRVSAHNIQGSVSTLSELWNYPSLLCRVLGHLCLANWVLSSGSNRSLYMRVHNKWIGTYAIHNKKTLNSGNHFINNPMFIYWTLLWLALLPLVTCDLLTFTIRNTLPGGHFNNISGCYICR